MPDVFVATNEDQSDSLRYGRVSETPPQEEPSIPEETPPTDTLPTVDIPLTPPSPSIAHEESSTPIAQQQFPVIPNYNLVHQSHTSNIPLFTSFWQNPTGVYFDSQGANEQILIFLRKHFITNLPWILSMVVLILLPFGIGYLLQTVKINLSLFSFFTPSQIRVFLTFYIILIFTYGFIKFLSWYYNISLITQERVLDIELNDLVDKKVAATKLSLVQDVTYQQSGAIGSMLDFGDVMIQTAGTQDNFIINSVPRPEMVIKIVDDLIGRERTVLTGA